MKELWVRDLTPGEELVEFFALRKKELRDYDGKPYLKLELADRTGRIDGVIWEEARDAYLSIPKGSVVKVQGAVTTYRDRPQITVKRIRIARNGEYALGDFLPSRDLDIGRLRREFEELARGIENEPVRRLLELFLQDEEFMERFCSSPAGKQWHHNYLGGLLEHTVSVAQLCKLAGRRYPIVSTDLLAAGALLHDIGKIEELEVGAILEYSDAGRLLGHITIGCRMAEDKIRLVPDLPEETANRIKHMILSHQGTLENASPVVPQTPEAFILHYVDQIDSKMNALERILSKERADGERWSEWVNLLDRYIYMGAEERPAQKEGDGQ